MMNHEYRQNLKSITINHESLAEKQQSLLEKLNSQLVASTIRIEYFRKLSAKVKQYPTFSYSNLIKYIGHCQPLRRLSPSPP